MWIAWNTAAYWAIGLAAFAVLVRGVRQPVVATAAKAARELVLVLTLYALWQYINTLTFRRVHGAEEHGRWVWQVQRWVHLPSEASLQHLVLPHGWLVQLFNGYYAILHGPTLIATLLWLFFCHRDRYSLVRNCTVLLTGLCLLIRLFPVAPPRLVPGLGFVDTGLLYHQSVYGTGTGGLSDQLSAMPSIHVAWALIVVLGVMTATDRPWRWLAVAHLVLTVLAVTVTANHWWLDGIVPAALLWGAVAVQRVRPRRSGAPSDPDSLAPAISTGSTSAG
jgi:hypothetical protein